MKKIIACLFFFVLLTSVCLAADFDGYIVKISDNTAEYLSENLSLFSDASLLSELKDSEVVELLSEELPSVKEINSRHMLVSVESEEALRELIELGIVEDYEEDIYLELLGYDVTLNPYYSNQRWYLDYINADFAWNAGIFGNDVKVAVIDSGVNQHSDIKKNLIPGKNYVENLDEDYTDDNSNHGTSVAGIIASECNSIATVGISFKTKIVPLKVTDNQNLSLSKAIAAIYDAVDYYNCDVINISFGSSTNSSELKNAVDYAIGKNVIIVAAAGNSGNTDNALIYPAAYDEVVSVANAKLGSGGATLVISASSQKNEMVDIAAPGTSIHAIVDTDSVSGTKSGTSFSCPMISAAAALAKSIKPSLTQGEFEVLLKTSANSSYLASSGQDSSEWGAGLLDIKALVQLLLGEEKSYLSDKVTIGGETFVYVTNLSDTEDIEKCTVVISEYNSSGYLDKIKYLTMPLSAATSFEVSLTEYGFSSSAAVRVICDYLPGDVDGDGKVGIRDASAILRYLAGYTVEANVALMDVNDDGEITILDASSILRYCAGYNVELH